MAILKDPLFSEEARGQVAKALVFKRGIFHPIVSAHFFHPVNWTPAKLAQAQLWRSLCDSWRSLTVSEQSFWSSLAPGVLTGFNYFMQLGGSLPIAPPYFPPTGDDVDFNFIFFPYSPPAGDDIIFDLGV